MKVIVKGIGNVTLGQTNYVATGGQASVYIKDKTAYKIYTDPKNTIPTDKFSYLTAIQDPNVIKPEALILNEKNTPIGYTMRAVDGAYSLCQLFTKGFRDRMHVDNDRILSLASKLRAHIANVHKANVIIVDLNELNILVPSTIDDMYLIDVDSYQTKGYPATVIMPSIRDFSVPSSKFSVLSDWYSYGILAFSMFIGIHPYRGTHAPSNQVEKDHRLEHRMRNHISAFNPEVKLPGCCYPLDSIPQEFRAWLKAVLEEGKRLAPPDPLQPGQYLVQTQTGGQQVLSTSDLQITKLFDLGGTLLAYDDDGQNCLTLTRTKLGFEIAMNGIRVSAAKDILPGTIIGASPRMNKPFGLYIKDQTLHVIDFTQKTTQVCGAAEALVRSGPGSYHIKNGSSIYELDFLEVSGLQVVATRAVANVMPKASKLYEGCCIQSIVGSVFVSLFPKQRLGYQIRVPELDKYRVLDAKFSGQVLMLYGSLNGVYNRVTLKFNEDFDSYDIETVVDVTPADVNFVTLGSLVCVGITEEARLEAFMGKKGAKGSKVVALPDSLTSATRLLRIGGKVAFEHNEAVYKLELGPSK